jgi:predicted NBD/HSP70 family sugar kinase
VRFTADSGVIITKFPTTGSFELIKNLNTSCILEGVRQSGLISRADIARQTGLTPATVSNITAELLELGLIAEAHRGISSGGRKPVMLSICPKVCYFAGVHISSDLLEVALADVEAEIICQEKVLICKPAKHEEVLEQAIELIKKLVTLKNIGPISGVGVSVHGLVNREEGLSVFAPNLGWENVHIGDIFKNAFNVPIVVENDVRAMTLAENWCGFARNEKDYIYLYIGSGIGGSIVINNEIYEGFGGYAGEFGHNTIVPDGPLCSCGNRGCLQAMASETTVRNRFIAKNKDSQCSAYNFADILAAAMSGNNLAREEILQSAQYIGIEVGNIINIFSPSLIVINGRISSLGSIVLDEINEVVRSRVLKYSQNCTRIVFSLLGDKASIKGAAACIIRQLFANPREFLRLRL